MYRRYYNEYEKKAQQIKSETAPQPTKSEIKPPLPEKSASFRYDDILILGLIFFLLKEGNADKMLLLALGFIFISGF